jgi:outer membrane protein
VKENLMSMSRLSCVALTRWIAFGAVLLAGSSALAEELKLGYVDMQRAISETDDGRKAKANLKKIFDQKQKELDEQQEEVKKAADDLEKKRTLLPADKVHEKEVEIQTRMQKVQQTYLRHQQDLQTKEQEAMGKIVERMNKILGKIAVSENFTMILDKTPGVIVFAKPSLDLTNDLIRRYNSGEGGDGQAAAPKKK